MRRGPGPRSDGFLSTLTWQQCYNDEGKDLGDIKEIMLDMASGKISYAVLAFGAFLGMGEIS